jgi:hypothetical protein
VNVLLELAREGLADGLVGALLDPELIQSVDDSGLIDLVHGSLSEGTLGDVPGGHSPVLVDGPRLGLPQEVDVPDDELVNGRLGGILADLRLRGQLEAVAVRVKGVLQLPGLVARFPGAIVLAGERPGLQACLGIPPRHRVRGTTLDSSRVRILATVLLRPAESRGQIHHVPVERLSEWLRHLHARLAECLVESDDGVRNVLLLRRRSVESTVTSYLLSAFLGQHGIMNTSREQAVGTVISQRRKMNRTASSAANESRWNIPRTSSVSFSQSMPGCRM